MLERPARILFLSLGVAVLLYFPAVLLTWPAGRFQVIQFYLSAMASVAAGFYLVWFRGQVAPGRNAASVVLVATLGLVMLESMGVVVTAWRID